MEFSRQRRVQQGGMMDQTEGPSSDSDDVRIVEENQKLRNKRTKKTVRKVKSKQEELLERTLRESGIDCTGMSLDEKENIAQAIMMSKQEADVQSQVEDNDKKHTDSEEEKHTTKAFREAVHPNSQSDDFNLRISQSLNTLETDDYLEDQTPVPLQVPVSTVTNDKFSAGTKAELKSDLLQNSSLQTAAAFAEAIHPTPTPPDKNEVMEEEPIPVSVEEPSSPSPILNVKPVQQRQIKNKNNCKKEGKNQTKMEQFSTVIIPDEDENRTDKDEDKYKGMNDLISEDESSPERKQKIRRRSDDVPEAGTSDAREKFTSAELNEFISEDESSSPIKMPASSKKKAFVWSDNSDEETQDLFPKQEDEHNVEDQPSKTTNSPAVTGDIGDQESKSKMEVSHQDDPVSADFYNFPPLQRRYRGVRKQDSATMFAPVNSSPTAYTKAIVQLFSLYHIRLSQLQKSSKNYLKWPEPVKVGFHLDSTIDARKRGLNYDFLEVDDDIQFSTSSKSVIPVTSDVNKNNNLTKPAAAKTIKLIKFEKNTPKMEVSAQDEIDDFLNTFTSKPALRSTRARNTLNFARQKMVDEFEPYPVDETFKAGAQQGRKRKLQDENDHKYCPIIQDDNSNDFDMRMKSTGKKFVKAIIEGGKKLAEKVETQTRRTKPIGNDDSKKVKRGSLRRFGSDLSTGSVESIKSEDLTNLLNPVRPPSRSSEASLDGLSQGSDVLIGPDGQIYSTQFCAMKEKRAKTPATKSGFNLQSVEDESIQYLPHNDENESRDGVSLQPKSLPSVAHIQGHSNVKGSTQKHTVTSPQDDAKLPLKTIKTESQRNVEEKPTSVKSRFFQTIGDFIKLGPTEKNDSKKTQFIDDEVHYPLPSHRVKTETSPSRPDMFVENQEFHQSNNFLEDDIQQIHVNKGGRTFSRRQERKRKITEEDDGEQNKHPKVPTVPCPLCNKEFPQNMIENHAADCNGPVDDENSRGSTESVQSVPDARSFMGTSPERQRPKSARKHHRQGNDSDFIEEAESEEENTKKFACYICDKMCKNQQVYNQHVEKCLENARQRQHQLELGEMDLEPEEIPVQRRTTRSARAPTPGYSSGSEEEKVTLREVVDGQSQSTTDESSYSDEYDWSPAKTPPACKTVNKEHMLPGGWTLEELTNSPIKSFVPIWKQSDSEGFKTQFDKAKKRFERQQMKGKGKSKQKRKQRKRKRKRKPSNGRKPAPKKQKCVD